MSVDWGRYNDLQARAAFAMNAYSGSYQDQSKNRLAMTAVGTPGWTQVNGWPALSGCSNGIGVNSGAVANIVDVTSSFSVESICTSTTQGLSPVIRQQSVGGGGLQFYCDMATPGVGYYAMILYTAAGAVARTLYLLPAMAALVSTKHAHLVMVCNNGGATATFFVGGVPIAGTLVGAGVAANSGAALVRVLGAGGGSTGNMTASLIRAYPFALTNADASCLYGAARSLVGEV